MKSVLVQIFITQLICKGLVGPLSKFFFKKKYLFQLQGKNMERLEKMKLKTVWIAEGSVLVVRGQQMMRINYWKTVLILLIGRREGFSLRTSCNVGGQTSASSHICHFYMLVFLEQTAGQLKLLVLICTLMY